MAHEELHNVIVKGYNVALSKGYDIGDMYVAGFLDGMKYQKDGTIPMSPIEEALERLKKEGKL